MTNKTKHTQLPWKITPQTDATRFAITDADNFHVLKINGGVVPTDSNAAFIVRAVNCHEELVAFLIKLEASLSFSTSDGKKGSVFEREWLKETRAALAKARGEA